MGNSKQRAPRETDERAKFEHGEEVLSSEMDFAVTGSFGTDAFLIEGPAPARTLLSAMATAFEEHGDFADVAMMRRKVTVTRMTF